MLKNNPLQKNAINSIKLGFEAYLNALMNSPIDNTSYLSAIRNIHSGFYLLMKSEIEIRAPKNAKETILAAHIEMNIINGKLHFLPKGKLTIGREQIFDRFKLVKITPKFTKRELIELDELRNEIEHRHPVIDPDKNEWDIYNDWVLKACNMILEFNDQFCKIKTKDLLGKGVLEKIRHKEEDEEKYEKLMKGEIEDEIEDFKLSNKHNNQTHFYFMNMDETESGDRTCNSLIRCATCPECSSTRLVPINTPRGIKLDFKIKCRTCQNIFSFKKVILEVLAHHYSYEMMKSLSKSGIFPLNKCTSCKSNTYLNYEHICFYCGSNEIPTELEEIEMWEINKLNPHDY